MEKYYTIHKFSKLIGKSAQTLRNWDKNGKLKPHHKSTNGYRYYVESQIAEVIGLHNIKEKKVIGYCRVSSNKQKDDLERQIENVKTYLLAQGEPFEVITDIGSGINYNKKGLQQLLRMMNNREVSKVVVLYKDRLLRFGFELVEYMAEINNCKIEIIDNAPKTDEQELVEDMIQTITVFSCRLQGKRAHKAKKMIKELKEDDSSEKS
ncbi:MAG: IS607 family transposase [Alkaliphilus sp.]|nr:IS607 family transposase [bacterium AH-315-L21]PHS33850.1 MAG: IS607 family transposase [Alkaliphilus sp.]